MITPLPQHERGNFRSISFLNVFLSCSHAKLFFYSGEDPSVRNEYLEDLGPGSPPKNQNLDLCPPKKVTIFLLFFFDLCVICCSMVHRFKGAAFQTLCCFENWPKSVTLSDLKPPLVKIWFNVIFPLVVWFWLILLGSWMYPFIRQSVSTCWSVLVIQCWWPIRSLPGSKLLSGREHPATFFTAKGTNQKIWIPQISQKLHEFPSLPNCIIPKNH